MILWGCNYILKFSYGKFYRKSKFEGERERWRGNYILEEIVRDILISCSDVWFFLEF